MIVANDLTKIQNGQHQAYLVTDDHTPSKLLRKQKSQRLSYVISNKKEHMTHITLAVTGSISAYKAADITSQLTKLGFEVKVLMTPSAQKFITPLTLQVLSKNQVGLDVMIEDDPQRIEHIDIGKETDLFLVAPASANTIAKLAMGLADNMVTSTALALPQRTKKLLAPAMNTKMLEHPATQRNLKLLQDYGYQIIQPRDAVLACGDKGAGALAPVETIVETVKENCL